MILLARPEILGRTISKESHFTIAGSRSARVGIRPKMILKNHRVTIRVMVIRIWRKGETNGWKYAEIDRGNRGAGNSI
jgi:hypothetical protein